MSCEDPIHELLPWYVNGTLEAGDMAQVGAHLQGCAACRTRVAALQGLAGSLAARPLPARLPDIEVVLARLPRRPSIRHASAWAWLLLRAQARVVRGEIWVASALVMTLGLLVTLAIQAALPLALVAPLVAAAGIAFLYGPAADPALEIELTTPASPRVVLLARLGLVFGFDLGLGLAASVVLALLLPAVSLWPLVLTWLAPMAFLSALAFLLTVLTADSALGALVSLVLWATWHLLGIDGLSLLARRLPDLLSAPARPWLWALALLLGGIAFWLAGREEHWLAGQA